jgi:hypothetical protein
MRRLRAFKPAQEINPTGRNAQQHTPALVFRNHKMLTIANHPAFFDMEFAHCLRCTPGNAEEPSPQQYRKTGRAQYDDCENVSQNGNRSTPVK